MVSDNIMSFSTLEIGPLVSPRGIPYSNNVERKLSVDRKVVSGRFYSAAHGESFLSVIQELPGVNIMESAWGCSVGVRRTGEVIGWIPPSELSYGDPQDPDQDVSAAITLVQHSPVWFSAREYSRWLREADVDPKETLAAIPPLSALDSDRVLRHAWRPHCDADIRGLPSWKVITDLILASEMRPPDSPFNALCRQAAEARTHGATIIEIIAEAAGMDLHLIEHLDREGFPEFEALAFRIRGDALETWAPVGNGCWGRLEF